MYDFLDISSFTDFEAALEEVYGDSGCIIQTFIQEVFPL